VIFYSTFANAESIYIIPNIHTPVGKIEYSEESNFNSNYTTIYHPNMRMSGSRDAVDPFATQIVMPSQIKSYIIQNYFTNITIFKFTPGKTKHEKESFINDKAK
jgi:hypothetical protein